MKQCKTCARVLPLTEFPARRKDRGTFGSNCKPCQREYCRRHYQENREHYLARPRKPGRNRVRAAKNRQKLLEYLAGKSCVDCGETDPTVFELDHVHGTKQFTIAKALGRRAWPQIAAELLNASCAAVTVTGAKRHPNAGGTGGVRHEAL